VHLVGFIIWYYWPVKLPVTPKPIMDKDGEENKNETANYQNYIHRFLYKENVTAGT
jgi:hypothetical protein